MNDGDLAARKKFVETCLEHGILVGADMLESLADYPSIEVPSFKDSSVMVLKRDYLTFLQARSNLSFDEIDAHMVDAEKRRVVFNLDAFNLTHPSHMDASSGSSESQGNPNGTVKVVFSYTNKAKKRDVQDFVSYFCARYKAIEKLLRNRQELSSITSISRVLQKKDKEQVSIIGMVKDKEQTKNGNLNITVEDLTGEISIVVNKSKPQLYSLAKDITFDEVIGVVGNNSNKVVFANNILWPDAPSKEIKKGPEECYALFLSDLHVGSKYFLREKFERFLKWINLESGSDEQKHIAKNTKYIFLAGDLVDGVGIYPSQEHELEIPDVREQYEECARLLLQIPQHINLIICPGNHDAMRLSEPQPPFYKDFSGSFLELKNATYVSNPAIVNIHSSAGFSGFDVMMYHGYSFDYYIANVETIRFNGGYDRADLVMKYLLQRRHLAPTHGSTLYLPDIEKDSLVIEQVPDILVTGHLHKTAVAQYKATTLICGSCWQDTTSFQIKVGHHPEPGRVPIVNLKTREVKVLRF